MAWKSDESSKRVWDEERGLELKVTFSRHATEFNIEQVGKPVLYFRAHRLPVPTISETTPSGKKLYYIRWGVSHEGGLEKSERRLLIAEALQAYKGVYGSSGPGDSDGVVEVLFDVEPEAGV